MYNSTSSLAICPTTDGLITCLFASLTGACLSSEDRTVSVVCSLWRSACSTNPEQMFGDGTQRWIPSQFISPESSGSFQSTQGMAGCPVTTCIRASVVCWAVGGLSGDATLTTAVAGKGAVTVTHTRVLFHVRWCRCVAVVQSLGCAWLCNPVDCDTPGFPVPHSLPEFAQTHVYWISAAIPPTHPLSPPSPLSLSFSQHQGLFQEICWCKVDTTSPSWMVSLFSTDPPLAKNIRLILSSSSKNEQNVPSMGLKCWAGGRKPVSNFVLIYLFNVIIY